MKAKNIFAIILLTTNTYSAIGQSAYPDEASSPSSPPSPLSYSYGNYSALNTQTAKFNYVRTYKPLTRLADINSSTSLTNIDVVTTYKNGWGNDIELNHWGTIGAPDLVIPVDQRSSLTKLSYLPYKALSGLRNSFIFYPFDDQQTYFTTSSNPEHIENGYSFGMSQILPNNGAPLNKVYSAGLSMVGSGVGNTSQTWYNTSSADGNLYIFDINSGLPHITSVYSDGQILVSEMQGPHNQVREYKNKGGQTIAKKTYNGYNWLTTYYLYNDLGKIVWILTPKVMTDPSIAVGWTLPSTVSVPEDKLCYHYIYNEDGLKIQEHIPDQNGDNYYVYDSKDRLILQQTPLLANQGKWSFTVYDSRDRMMFSGLVNSNNNQTTWASVLSGAVTTGTIEDFLKNGFSYYPGTVNNCELDKFNYYDDYSGLPSPLSSRSPITTYSVSAGDFLTGAGIETYAVNTSLMYGKLVASRTRVIDPTNPNLWINTIYYYDNYGRLVQSQTLNPWNMTDWDIDCKQYDFAGNVVMDIDEHHSWSGCTKANTVIRTKYSYEIYTGALHSVEQKIDNSGWRELSSYLYQKRRVIRKILGGAEVQNYTYNIRGQLTSINDEHVKDNSKNNKMTFGEDICYDYGFKNKRFDGSIAGYIWRGSGSAAMPRAYGYIYDGASKMLGADFTERVWQYPAGSPIAPGWYNNTVDYSVSNIGYDANGNISNLRQKGMVGSTPVLVDNLTYNYLPYSNKLASVGDYATYHNPDYDFWDGYSSGNDYDYDKDGNLSQDLNKGITNINYNYLDLPLSVTKGANSINNIYDAEGDLLQKTVVDGANIDVYRYWGPFVYLNNDLQYVMHDEGRSRYLGNGAFALDFFVKDHLDNVRTVVNSKVEDVNTYNSDPGIAPPGSLTPVRVYHAGFEVLSANVESAVFTSIDSMREVSPLGTPDDQMSGALEGSDPNNRVGAAIMLHVMTGDEYNVKAFGYYSRDDSANMNTYCQPMDMMNSVLNTLQAGTYGLNFGEMGSAPGISPSVPSSVLTPINYNVYESIKSSITDPAYPRTYLNVLMFDENMNIVPDLCKAVQLVGNANAWNIMDAGNMTVNRAGYLLMYLSNESIPKSHVDNFHLYNIVGDLVQEEHYYPHGLHYDYSLASGTLQSNYLYQDKKLQRELGLNLYDFHARQYDAQIGRFWGIDPLSQFPSGYTGMGNDPANNVDPTGMATNYRNPVDPSLEPQSGKAILNTMLQLAGDNLTDPGYEKILTGAEDAWGPGGGSGSLEPGAQGEDFSYYYSPDENEVDGSAKQDNKSNASANQNSDESWWGAVNNTVFTWTYAFNTTVNPLYSAVNAVNGLVTGKDFTFGTQMSKSEIGVNILSTIPIFGEVKNVENVAQVSSHLVYEGIDAAGVTRYVGRTSRESTARFAEHLKSVGTGKELLRYRVVQQGLPKIQSRVLEQQLINQYGLQKNGGQLINKVNSIAPIFWPFYGIR